MGLPLERPILMDMHSLHSETAQNLKEIGIKLGERGIVHGDMGILLQLLSYKQEQAPSHHAH